MRYTEARMSPFAAMMLEDLKLDTVDFVPTYDERHTEPIGPAVEVSEPAGQRRRRHRGRHGHQSIPPHNLGEVCRGVIALIDDPDITDRTS